jgi:hypothetical protein
MKVGDTVEYKGKEYYLYSIYKGDLCRIVRFRDGKYTHTKQGIEYLNANIVNLNINELKLII